LTRRFGTVTAVDGVDLEVRRGEIFGCLGPNGSGKSTLMRMLLGLLEPSAGSATVLGAQIPRDADQLRASVGYMTQHFSLYRDLSVRENLEFAAEIFGLPAGTRRRRVDAALAEHTLTAYAETRAEVLSGGWRQRLALATATLHAPRLLVLDEPTAGVDPQSRREFWERLFGLASQGTTIFVSTHYMDEAVRCHRLCILRDGRRVALGAPAELVAPLASRILDVSGCPPEKAISALREVPLVVSTTQLGDIVHVLLGPGITAQRAASQVCRSLEAAGLPGVRAEPGRANLEDVFVALLMGEQLVSETAAREARGQAVSS
jgi:ABC-2 type transport system ATP-binding protein